jgi:hypothetical protein
LQSVAPLEAKSNKLLLGGEPSISELASMQTTLRVPIDGMPDSGDTAFVIISGALVLMMTLPGFMLFYGSPLPRPVVLAYCYPCRANPAAGRASAQAARFPAQRGDGVVPRTLQEILRRGCGPHRII